MMKKYWIPFIIAALPAVMWSCSKSDNAMDGGKNSNQGKGGSTARIAIKGNYLYAVDNNSLKVVDISTPDQPVYVKTINIGFGIETLYPFKDYLFIGSNSGMYVYGLSDPSSPGMLSQFEHFTACDPVIANDSLAFVTLRNTEICNRWADVREIDVVDIKDIVHPYSQLIYYTRYDPYGLDMLDTLLFVCHGQNGLIVYDINKMLDGTGNAEISSISGLNAFDAIVWQNKLFVVGESGFYQYDYSDIYHLKLISSIPKSN